MCAMVPESRLPYSFSHNSRCAEPHRRALGPVHACVGGQLSAPSGGASETLRDRVRYSAEFTSKSWIGLEKIGLEKL